jgi:hypothetical protein
MAQEPESWSCHRCGVVWFGFDAARAFFVLELPPHKSAPPPFPLIPTGHRCPECPGELGHMEVDPELILDQCERCGGLLFDEGESLSLKGRLLKKGFRDRVAEVIHTFRQGPYR